jgi:hypothetical protein
MSSVCIIFVVIIIIIIITIHSQKKQKVNKNKNIGAKKVNKKIKVFSLIIFKIYAIC